MTPRVRLYAEQEGQKHGLSAANVLEQSRERRRVRARWVVMRRLRTDGFSTPKIAQWLGMNHSTVIYGLQRESAMIHFTVPGLPRGKGRARIANVRGKVRAYTPGKTVAYEGLIALAGRDAMANAVPYEGPVAIEATAVFPIPASWSKARKAAAQWHTSKPDADNIAKSLGDGLNGVAWRDDSQVASMRILKVYGDTPGLHVTVTAL